MNKFQKASAAAVLTLGALLSFASTAGADAVTDQIDATSDTLVTYAAPLAVAIGAIVAVFIGLPLIKRFARMVRNAVG
jgi:hypothetical protein